MPSPLGLLLRLPRKAGVSSSGPFQTVCTFPLWPHNTVLSFLLLVFGSPARLRAPRRQRPGQIHAVSGFLSGASLGQAFKRLRDKGKKKREGHVFPSLAPLSSCIKYRSCAYPGQAVLPSISRGVWTSLSGSNGPERPLQKQEALGSSQGPGLYECPSARPLCVEGFH